MKNKREMPLKFKYRVLQERVEKKDRNLRNFSRLVALVHPAPVIHIDDVKDIEQYDTITRLALTHGYRHEKLRLLLQRENILMKKDGHWMFTEEYSDKNLCIYVVGYKRQYKKLYLFLTAEGVDFMLRFIETHPIKHHKPKIM